MSRRTQAQLSISTSSPGSGAYDLFYDEAYKGPFLPTVFMVTETFLDRRDASGIRAALYTPGALALAPSAVYYLVIKHFRLASFFYELVSSLTSKIPSFFPLPLLPNLPDVQAKL